LGEVEKFFFIGCQVDEIELKELMLRRYGRYDFPEMKFGEYIDFIVLAINNDRKEKIREEYLVLLPYFVQSGNYMSFDNFYEQATGSNIDWRSTEEIMKEVEEIKERFEHGN